jgi:hypothetical protein
MGEIEDITGDTQFDLFKRLENVGFSVRREGRGRGMRIWLAPKVASVADNLGEPLDADVEPVSPVVERWTLSLERDLQRALRGSLEQLEPGLVVIDGGRESDFRDITAKDKHGSTVVIELKAVRAGPEAVAQLLSYMGELKLSGSSAGLRGFLVAPDFHPRALAAAAMVPSIVLKRYVFHLSFDEPEYPRATRPANAADKPSYSGGDTAQVEQPAPDP